MKNWTRQLLRPTGRNALTGIGIATLAIAAGIFTLLRNPTAGTALILIGTFLAVVSASRSASRLLQRPVLKVRVGGWIVLLCMVLATVAAVRGSFVAGDLVLFGLWLSCAIGKPQHQERESGRDDATSR